MERARTVLLSLAALLTFAIALFSLYMNRPATGGVSGALSLAFVLLLQLPKLESFEVLTLKVKLRQQLSDAEQLLNHLRENAGVTSQLMYMQLAFMNRIGSIPWSRKRVLLSEIDEHLRKLQVSSEVVRDYKKPFLNLISYDLSRVFQDALNIILREHGQLISKQIDELSRKRVAADDGELAKLIKARTDYARRTESYEDISADPRLENLQDLTSSWMIGLSLADDEAAALRTIQAEVVALAQSCWDAGTITPATEQYLAKYGDGARNDARLKEIRAA